MGALLMNFLKACLTTYPVYQSQLQQAIWATSKDLSLELGSAPMDVVAVRHANERYLTSSSWLQCSL